METSPLVARDGEPFAPDAAMIDVALWYARRNIPVSPGHWPVEVAIGVPGLLNQQACSCDVPRRRDWAARWGRKEPYCWCEKPGKHPLLAGKDGGAGGGTTDFARIRQLWGEHPCANARLDCGSRSGLVVLDFEKLFTPRFVPAFETLVREDWDDARTARERERWEREGQHLRDVVYPLVCRAWDELRTPKVSTASGGGHVYLRVPPGIRIASRWLSPACEVLGEGKQVTAPPSRTWSGAYEWFDECGPTPGLAVLGGQHAVDPHQKRLLADLLELLGGPHRYADARSSGGVSLGSAVDGPVLGAGQRRGTLCSIAAQLRTRGKNYADINEILQAVNEARCRPPHERNFVADIAKWAAGKPPGRVGQRARDGDDGEPVAAPSVLRLAVETGALDVAWGTTSANLDRCPLCDREGAVEAGHAWIWFKDLALRCDRPDCAAGKPDVGSHRGAPLRAWVTLVAPSALSILDGGAVATSNSTDQEPAVASPEPQPGSTSR